MTGFSVDLGVCSTVLGIASWEKSVERRKIPAILGDGAKPFGARALVGNEPFKSFAFRVGLPGGEGVADLAGWRSLFAEGSEGLVDLWRNLQGHGVSQCGKPLWLYGSRLA